MFSANPIMQKKKKKKIPLRLCNTPNKVSISPISPSHTYKTHPLTFTPFSPLFSPVLAVNLYADRSPRAHRIDPTQFMLSNADRKMSEPVFSSMKPPPVDERHLSRSPEVENIPERVHGVREDKVRHLR